MKQAYGRASLKAATLVMIGKMDQILKEYHEQGYVLTIRQLYYQLVARGEIPNNILSYKRVVDIAGLGRMCGYLDWDRIVDRNRETQHTPSWDSPRQILDAAASQFKLDAWKDQPCWIEVMVEKDALSGVLAPVCYDERVLFTANKGYTSLSAIREAGLRIGRKVRIGKKVTVIYLGDHDPSGIDMTRDITDRLALFAGTHQMDILRVALNFDQVQEYDPPENPAKQTDSRYQAYVDAYGESSWELDALNPGILSSLVRDAIRERRDDDLWAKVIDREDAYKSRIHRIANTFESEEDEDDDLG